MVAKFVYLMQVATSVFWRSTSLTSCCNGYEETVEMKREKIPDYSTAIGKYFLTKGQLANYSIDYRSL